ncbi:hypothetical protein [Streptomyces europaeiscabiei]
MTTTHPGPSRMDDVRVPATVAQAEAAWLVAITTAMRNSGNSWSPTV